MMTQKPKYQSLIIITLSLALMVVSIRGLLQAKTVFQYALAIAGISILMVAAIGAWYRKPWVQYCFFTLATYSLLTTVFMLLAGTVQVCCALDTVFLMLNIYTILYIFNLIYFATGYLAKHYFDEKVSLQNNSWMRFLLASGIASVVMAISIWGEDFIYNLLMSEAKREQLNLAIFRLFESWGIAENWWLMLISLPQVIVNVLLVAITVYLISQLWKAWSRWYVVVGTLYMTSIIFLVLGLQNLIAFIKEDSLRSLIPEITWSPMIVIVASYFIVGLLTSKSKKKTYQIISSPL